MENKTLLFVMLGAAVILLVAQETSTATVGTSASKVAVEDNGSGVNMIGSLAVYGGVKGGNAGSAGGANGGGGGAGANGGGGGGGIKIGN